ncbi:magnesium transporter [Rariglobus hedericola]|uniref:Magnesium transporter n=1 Tax=Rariglobus hedericola TaxID=2597822 RepID=A0A556QQZ5_9BACT|nr:magnesium transporter [Rariglobus hedericola]TSJ79052.1 magnesium transporter [Rariglobus hedericola]
MNAEIPIVTPLAASDNTLNRLLENPAAIFPPELTVHEATERIREIIKTHFVTYVYVTDRDNRLLGIVTMRDLLLAAPDTRLDTIMLHDPFLLKPDMPLMDAIKLTVNKHFPCYPVCDDDGRLAGIVWGAKLFAAQAIEISAQAGSMVGVDKEEHTTTHWKRSFRFRHPWLLINLVTAGMAASVVGAFQGSISKIVALAVFLPLIAGQSGNTGCQSLAVALRGMTLGELKPGRARFLLAKEAILGALNGFVVGILAGIGMWMFATSQHTAEPPLILGITVCMAMTIACTASSMAGVMVPVILRRCGADPVTASSIFVTTSNDIISMGCFLGLATLLLL